MFLSAYSAHSLNLCENVQMRRLKTRNVREIDSMRSQKKPNWEVPFELDLIFWRNLGHSSSQICIKNRSCTCDSCSYYTKYGSNVCAQLRQHISYKLASFSILFESFPGGIRIYWNAENVSQYQCLKFMLLSSG